ncbi:MAG TPA: type 1 glutamine amidotransferase [Methyloceanibacter sp.]|nr:type 1 glutamine amidotransferase [Methyloceanibacter sp.]
MKPIRIFRHEDWINPGRLTDYLDARAIPWELVRIDQNEPVPQDVDDVSGLAFLGGTMSVNDGYPWLEEELRLIRSAAVCDLPMLGHCMGSQLIAKALGGEVRTMPAKEVGWYEVSKLDNPATREWLAAVPDRFEVLIWHHDAFSLPPGAALLYSTAHCPEQAYVLGNTVATVAHAEVTADMLEEWLRIYGHDIDASAPSVQPIEQVRERLVERCAAMHRTFTDRLYDAWLARVLAYAERPRERAEAE